MLLLLLFPQNSELPVLRAIFTKGMARLIAYDACTTIAFDADEIEWVLGVVPIKGRNEVATG
jgi:hypothetical protein